MLMQQSNESNNQLDDKLNFTQIVFAQIERILIAKSNMDWERYTIDIDSLEALLTFYIDEPYQDKLRAANDSIKKQEKQLPEAPEDFQRDWNKLMIQKASNRFALLMDLAGRLGLLPRPVVYD